ncbi:unnamed protein product, partial [Mesorhabditis spiculigera]
MQELKEAIDAVLHPSLGARRVPAPLAERLFGLSQGARPWMNLGEHAREKFFAVKAEEALDDLSYEELIQEFYQRKLALWNKLKEAFELLGGEDGKQELLLQQLAANQLFRAKMGHKLSSIVREGRVQSMDDAFFAADEIVSSVVGQLA